MRTHPDSAPVRGLRGAALVLASVLAVLIIAPAASTRTAAASAAPAAAAGTARAGSFEASGAPSTRIVLAKADPCAALFGSVKQACENFGKSSGSGSKSGSSGSSSTSVLNIPGQVEQAVDAWFGDLVKSALTPVLTLLGKLVLSTPDLTGGRIDQIYTITLGIADAVFVLLVVVGGVIVMGHETIQTRYAIKQILPRLVLGFIAANLSIHFVSRALQFGNAMTQAIWSTPLSGAGIGNQLIGYILTSIFLPDGVTQVFMVLFGLVLAVLALAVVFSFALRTAGLLLLVILAPPMLLCHALPGLDAIALLWWRLLGALLAIGFLQAATLMLMLNVFFDPDSNVLGVPTSAGLIDLVVCGALFVILLKIPGWVLRMVLGRAPRSSVMGLIRTAATAAIGTAIGVPGAGSARMLAARFGGRAVATGLGSTPPPGAAGGGRRPVWANPIRHAPRFGTAHGRPTASGQGVLFPIPKGAQLTAEQVRRRAAIRSGHARGGWPTPAPKATKRPRFQQPALFDRDGHIPPSEQAPRRISRQRQEALCPMPEGARLTRAQAHQRLERLDPSRSAWHPEPAQGRSPYRQPALFNRQGRLHPDVKNAATPRPKAVPATPPAVPPKPARARNGTAKASPASGAAGSGLRTPKALPPPVPGTPSAAGRTPQSPPETAPRMVPVRMAAAPKPRKPRRNRRTANGGEPA
jgi:hypothetical protein